MSAVHIGLITLAETGTVGRSQTEEFVCPDDCDRVWTYVTAGKWGTAVVTIEKRPPGTAGANAGWRSHRVTGSANDDNPKQDCAPGTRFRARTSTLDTAASIDAEVVVVFDKS